MNINNNHNKRGPKKGSPINTTDLCGYGCGERARFINNSGNFMCGDSANKCSVNRMKNSDKALESYENGRSISDFGNKRGWSKGLSKETDDRVLKQSNSLTGKRRITDEEKLKKVIYRESCDFNLSSCIEKVMGYQMLVNLGMYDLNKNPGGVVRDHRISVLYGFKNNIDPKIISHPANCEFILHSSNARKTFRNSCSLEQLMEDIEKWGREGKLVYLVE